MLSTLFNKSVQIPGRESALPDRVEKIRCNPRHFVSGNSIVEPVPQHLQKAVFGLGCFWGAERKFWQLPGVFSTASGYSAGHTANPTYEDICTGRTGHAEVVLVFFDPHLITFDALLKTFWESHDPTQGMRQGNDRGTQYRSGVYCCNEEQLLQAQSSLKNYQLALDEAGIESITTEIVPLETFYYAEDYHQQYLAKNPRGYCGLGGTGVSYKQC